MEKKGLFAGWKDVFSFTAAQELKGGKYKLTTILIGIFIALIFGAISVIMAITQLDDEEKVEVENDFLNKVTKVYLVENEILEDELMNTLVSSALSLEGAAPNAIEVEHISKNKVTENVANEKSLVVELVSNADNDNKEISFNAVIPNGDKDRKKVASEYLEYVVTYIEIYGTTIAGVQIEDLPYFVAPFTTQSVSVNDKVQNFAVMLIGMFVPMIFSTLLFTMIILYGQNITKVVCAEKSSKLMEMILTSVRPYALITGKILAAVSLALGQIFIWIACGFGGYMAGTVIADIINPDYVNYVNTVIDLFIANNGASAFTWYSVVLAIIFVALGFLVYSVFAGLMASSISKIEDLSNIMQIFQIPVMIGWFAAYLVPLMESKILNTVVHIFPLSAPFIVPGDIILGKCGIIEGAISLVLLVATTVGCILLTGKIYKNKIFYRK